MNHLETLVPAVAALLLAVAGYLRMRSANEGLRRQLDEARSVRPAPPTCTACLNALQAIMDELRVELGEEKSRALVAPALEVILGRRARGSDEGSR